MIDILKKNDFGDIAWSNFLMQFKESPILKCFVKSLYQPFDDLQQAFIDLMDKRTLKTAIGRQLDGIGDIVGIKRPVMYESDGIFFGFLGQTNSAGFGQAPFIDLVTQSSVAKASALNDEDYRKLIQFKIYLNNGHGTADEIYQAMRFVFGASQVIIEELGNAKIKIYFDREEAPNFILFNAKSYIPKSAGVGVELYGELAKEYFGFYGGLNSKGFNQAPFIDNHDLIEV